MKWKTVKWSDKLPFIFKYLFNEESARSLGKKVNELHLTKCGTYKYNKNGCGSLIIYQWVKYYFNSLGNYPDIWRYDLSRPAKDKDTEIKRLKRQLKQSEKRNREYEEVIKISKYIIKKYVPKNKKKVIDEAKQQTGAKVSINKINKLLGHAKSTYYSKPKTKKLNLREEEIYQFLMQKYSEFKYAKTLGRRKLLLFLNKFWIEQKHDYIKEWELRKILQKHHIKAKLAHRPNKPRDPKNVRCKRKDLIKRKWYSNEPGKKLFTDVTYLDSPNGFIYISSIVDGFDNNPLGYAVSSENDTNLVINSLSDVKIKIDGSIIHSDHGATYSSYCYDDFCKLHDMKISMGKVGVSLDNYPIEHHFSFLKTECLWNIPFEERTLEKVNSEIRDYYSWFISLRPKKWNSKRKKNNLYNNLTESCPTIFS